MPYKIYTPGGRKLEVLEQIGNGSYGRVYLASSNNIDYAIKVVVPNSNEFDIYECRKERRNTKKCKNLPYVMNYYELFILNGILYIVMPLYNNIPKNSEPEQIAKWFYQLLIGINGIHQKGIIHGDIKNGNILLSENDEIRIIDFGISVQQGSKERDICPHILKSKKRLRETLETLENFEKKQKSDDGLQRIKNIEYPEATPYDDLVAAAYTIISFFNCGNILQTKVEDTCFPKKSIENLLKEIDNIDLMNKIDEIISSKCSHNKKLYDFFKEFITEILSFSDEHPITNNIIKKWKKIILN